jgi:hypothetical protein
VCVGDGQAALGPTRHPLVPAIRRGKGGPSAIHYTVPLYRLPPVPGPPSVDYAPGVACTVPPHLPTPTPPDGGPTRPRGNCNSKREQDASQSIHPRHLPGSRPPHQGSFKRGHPKHGGRQAGTPNAISARVPKAIAAAAKRLARGAPRTRYRWQRLINKNPLITGHTSSKASEPTPRGAEAAHLR